MRTSPHCQPVGRSALLAAILPAALAAQEPRQFGAASFAPPPGWSLESKPDLQLFSRVRGQDRCMLVLSSDAPAPAGTAAAFASAWRGLFGSGFRSAPLPQAAERTSAAGARYLFGEGGVEDAGGNRLVARLHLFPVGAASSQWVVLIGNGAAALSGCQGDWDAFFRSLRFGSPTPAPATVEGPQEFENLRFVVPAGWSFRRLGEVVHLSRSGVRDPERLEVFLLPGHVASNLEAEVAGGWEEVRALIGAVAMRNVSGQTFDLDGPSTDLAGVEYLKGNGGMRMGGAEWDVSIYAFRAGERIERVAVVAAAFTENLGRYTTANRLRFSGEIRRLVFGMRFANLAATPRAPTGLAPGGIVGVWAGLGMSFGSIKTQFAVFFDNGLAYFGPGFPLEGLHEINPVAEQPGHQRDWGTYTWDGSAGVLTLPYGPVPLRSTGTGLELTTNRTAHRYIRLVLPASRRLDGTWCYDDGKCVRFTPDGKFDDTGAVRVAEHSLYAWPESPAGGAGTYTLRDHTLVLAYDGGPELRVAFPGVEDGRTSSPDRIRFGWNADLLTRR